MTDQSAGKSGAIRPEYAAALEAAYGAPSQAAFGSAVFCEPLPSTVSLEHAALERYRFFTGKLWDRYGEDAWMGPWRQVYSRPVSSRGDIAAELRALEDRGAAMSVSMVLDVEGGEAALATAFDDPAVSELAVFTLGDGGAMSGLLVAARRQETDQAIFLVFLLD